MTPETAAKIAVWRQKLASEQLSLEEMKEIVTTLRADRRGAAVTSEQARRAKAKVAVRSAAELLAAFGVK